MLQRLNVKWILVGHSERRAMYAMTDEVVAQTLRTVVRQGLQAVLCVGEELEVRESEGHHGLRHGPTARRARGTRREVAPPGDDRLRAGLGHRHGSHRLDRAGRAR